MPHRIAVIAGLGLTLVGCGGSDATTTTTVTTKERASTERLERFAYREVKTLAIRTCSVVGQDALAQAFDLKFNTANAVALKFVRDIDIRPIALQTAAYDGCLAGLGEE